MHFLESVELFIVEVESVVSYSTQAAQQRSVLSEAKGVTAEIVKVSEDAEAISPQHLL